MSYDLKIVNGDFSLKNGDLETTIDNDKLIQDILKICLTDVGTNPMNPGYGSFLSRAIIGNPGYISTLVSIGKSQLNTALENLKKLQDTQLKSLQRVSAAEQLAAILDISIINSNIDPRLFNVSIVVLSKDLQRKTISFEVTTI